MVILTVVLWEIEAGRREEEERIVVEEEEEILQELL